MILLLAFLYLVLCYCTQTFAFNTKYGFMILILGLVYDILEHITNRTMNIIIRIGKKYEKRFLEKK